MTCDLSNRVALVTGASRGLGAAMARELGACGAKVAVNYAVNRERAQSVAQEIIVGGGQAAAFGADVRDEAEVARLVREVEERFGAIDILVINATGPWTDRTRQLGVGGARPLMRPTKGVHLVVDSARLGVGNAIVCFHPRDGRVLFAIPWGDRTYIGTTDTDFAGDPGEVAADAADVSYLLEATNHYFPDARLGPEDVIATWAGVRPLISEADATSESSVSREHEILVDSDGLITIAGGKLTTYRRMGAEVIDKALGLLMVMGQVPRALRMPLTDKEPLPGAVGWPDDDDHERVAKAIEDAGGGAISASTARLLGDTYGMRGMDLAGMASANSELARPLVAGRPEIFAQVDFAVQRELAATVSDVLVRRTQIYFRDLDQGLGACEAVAERMAPLLGWDEQRTLAEVLAYQEEVARSRRWREG